jgi:hypothetical protein
MSTYEMAAHVNLRVSPTNPDSIPFMVNSLLSLVGLCAR